MAYQVIAGLIALLAFTGCAGVRQQPAWEGQPVELLDRHPVFLTMRLDRSTGADGTEIRNYVDGAMLCNEGDCTSKFGACNNIFYIKNGYVVRYTPMGTGGAKCATDGLTSPRFTGPANLLP